MGQEITVNALPPEQTTAVPLPAATATAPEGDTDLRVREHPAFKNVTAQLSELQKFRDQKLAEEKAETERKALANQEYEKVIAARDADIAARDQKLAELERKNLVGTVERMLLSSGATDDLYREGIMARFDRDKPEDLNAWIAKQKQDHPKAFANSQSPISSGAPGNVAGGATNTLEQRLKSDEPKVKKAAASEKMRNALFGK